MKHRAQIMMLALLTSVQLRKLAPAGLFGAALTRCSMTAANCLAADERKFETRRSPSHAMNASPEFGS